MSRARKKRAFQKGAISKTVDFEKKKHKLGKKALPDNVTNTTVQTRQIYVPNQGRTERMTDKMMSETISKCVNHHNVSFRVQNINALTNALDPSNNNNNNSSQNYAVVGMACSLLGDANKQVRVASYDLLRRLYGSGGGMNVLDTAVSETVKLKILTALTNLNLYVRLFVISKVIPIFGHAVVNDFRILSCIVECLNANQVQVRHKLDIMAVLQSTFTPGAATTSSDVVTNKAAENERVWYYHKAIGGRNDEEQMKHEQLKWLVDLTHDERIFILRNVCMVINESLPCGAASAKSKATVDDGRMNNEQFNAQSYQLFQACIKTLHTLLSLWHGRSRRSVRSYSSSSSSRETLEMEKIDKKLGVPKFIYGILRQSYESINHNMSGRNQNKNEIVALLIQCEVDVGNVVRGVDMLRHVKRLESNEHALSALRHVIEAVCSEKNKSEDLQQQQQQERVDDMLTRMCARVVRRFVTSLDPETPGCAVNEDVMKCVLQHLGPTDVARNAARMSEQQVKTAVARGMVSVVVDILHVVHSGAHSKYLHYILQAIADVDANGVDIQMKDEDLRRIVNSVLSDATMTAEDAAIAALMKKGDDDNEKSIDRWSLGQYLKCALCR